MTARSSRSPLLTIRSMFSGSGRVSVASNELSFSVWARTL
jgi:hypothetical protein